MIMRMIYSYELQILDIRWQILWLNLDKFHSKYDYQKMFEQYMLVKRQSVVLGFNLFWKSWKDIFTIGRSTKQEHCTSKIKEVIAVMNGPAVRILLWFYKDAIVSKRKYLWTIIDTRISWIMINCNDK